MEAKKDVKKTAEQEMHEKQAKEARKPSEELIDKKSGAIENAKKPATGLTAHHDPKEIASEGRVTGFTASELEDVKELDDKPATAEEIAAKLPKAQDTQRLGVGVAKAPGSLETPHSDNSNSQHFDRNEGVPVKGAGEAHKATESVKGHGSDVMRDAGGVSAPRNATPTNVNKR